MIASTFDNFWHLYLLVLLDLVNNTIDSTVLNTFVFVPMTLPASQNHVGWLLFFFRLLSLYLSNLEIELFLPFQLLFFNFFFFLLLSILIRFHLFLQLFSVVLPLNLFFHL
jgi:hypothetical protein